MQELEQIKLIIKKFPYNFIKVLNSKENAYLISYIQNNTQLLIDSLDFKYQFKTRLFWIINQITSWNDDHVKCKVCRKPFINLNVKKLSIGYKQTCCKRCERILAQDSCSQNLKLKYGVCNSFQINGVKETLKAKAAEIQLKRDEKKRLNHTFKSSKKEERAYWLLCMKFGAHDIVRQYKSSVYPFNCDFYVKSHDLYIECNFSWTHGRHFFNSNDSRDIEKLKSMRSKHSKYYDNAIITWTVRDVAKYSTAIANGLNYLIFWTIDEVERYCILLQ